MSILRSLRQAQGKQALGDALRTVGFAGRAGVGRWGGVADYRSGTELDKPWGTLLQEFTFAREAWKRNPLARRIIGLTTAYVVGNGIRVKKDFGPAERKAWDNAEAMQ